MKRTYYRTGFPQPIHGFTLIELLVVVTIIAVLIAILLPALSQARERAKASLCLSNQREIGIAIQQYAHDYNDYLPGLYDRSQANYWDRLWHTNLLRHHYLPSSLRSSAGEPVIQDVLRCPSILLKSEKELESLYPGNGMWLWKIQVYGMRAFDLGQGPFNIYTETFPARSLGRISNPSDFFVVADSFCIPYGIQGYSVGGLYSGGPAGNDGRWRICLAHQNRKKANVLMADGHAESKGENYLCSQPVYPDAVTPVNGAGHYYCW